MLYKYSVYNVMNKHILSVNKKGGTGEVAQQPRVCAALPADLSSVPGTHFGQLTPTCISSYKRIPPFCPPQASARVCTHPHADKIINKVNLLKVLIKWTD